MSDPKLFDYGRCSRERRGSRYVASGWSFVLFLGLFGLFVNGISMLRAQSGIGKEYLQFIDGNRFWGFGGVVAFVSIIVCCVLISHVRMQTIKAWLASSQFWKRYTLLLTFAYPVGFLLVSLVGFVLQS